VTASVRAATWIVGLAFTSCKHTPTRSVADAVPGFSNDQVMAARPAVDVSRAPPHALDMRLSGTIGIVLAGCALSVPGCAIPSTPSDSGPDATADGTTFEAGSDADVDSAWCRATTCEMLADQCHQGICDRLMPFPPCFDTRLGVCSRYACTAPCGDAGTDAM